MQHRLNLFNYHQQQLKFLKLRVYVLLGIAIFMAALFNVLSYTYVNIQIYNQTVVNKFWSNQLQLIDKQVEPIREFKKRSDEIKDKIKLIKFIDDKRDDSIALVHAIYKETPDRLYYTNVNTSLDNSTISLKGVAGGPLFIARLLDNMRESGSPFVNVSLKSNLTNDQNSYNVEIASQINKSLLKIEYESYGR